MKYLLLLLTLASTLNAQQAKPAVGPRDPKRPAFEVASIKPAGTCAPTGRRTEYSPGRLQLPCVTLRALLRMAYFAGTGQRVSEGIAILGGPAWLDTDRFAISAKAEGPAGENEIRGPMMHTLLGDRFHVSLHKELRDTSVYELVVANGGAKLHIAKEGSCVPTDPQSPRPRGPKKAGETRPKRCGQIGYHPAGDVLVGEWRSVTLGGFADGLRSRAHRPVLDRTGLTGKYDIQLELAPSELTSGPRILNGQMAAPAETAAADTGGPTIFEALQKQLGLKLVSTTTQQELLIVDRAEKPGAFLVCNIRDGVRR